MKNVVYPQLLILNLKVQIRLSEGYVVFNAPLIDWHQPSSKSKLKEVIMRLQATHIATTIHKEHITHISSIPLSYTIKWVRRKECLVGGGFSFLEMIMAGFAPPSSSSLLYPLQLHSNQLDSRDKGHGCNLLVSHLKPIQLILNKQQRRPLRSLLHFLSEIWHMIIIIIIIRKLTHTINMCYYRHRRIMLSHWLKIWDYYRHITMIITNITLLILIYNHH